MIAKELRNIARHSNRIQRKKAIKSIYVYLLKIFKSYAKQGHMKFETNWYQIFYDFTNYMAVRMIDLYTDINVRVLCDDEDYSIGGDFCYHKWAQTQDNNTRIKVIFSWSK